MDSLPVEVKMQVLSNLPYELVSFITDDYFWLLYCRKYNVPRKFAQFSWKANYIINSICGNCEYIASLHGSELFFGQVNEKYQLLEYTVQTEDPHFFHIFRKDKACLKSYFIFQSEIRNEIGEEVYPNLVTPITKDEVKRDIKIKLRKQVCNTSKLIYFRNVYNFIRVQSGIKQSDNLTKSKGRNKISHIIQNEQTVGIVVPQRHCGCKWRNLNTSDLTAKMVRKMYLEGRNCYLPILQDLDTGRSMYLDGALINYRNPWLFEYIKLCEL